MALWIRINKIQFLTRHSLYPGSQYVQPLDIATKFRFENGTVELQKKKNHQKLP